MPASLQPQVARVELVEASRTRTPSGACPCGCPSPGRRRSSGTRAARSGGSPRRWRARRRRWSRKTTSAPTSVRVEVDHLLQPGRLEVDVVELGMDHCGVGHVSAPELAGVEMRCSCESKVVEQRRQLLRGGGAAEDVEVRAHEHRVDAVLGEPRGQAPVQVAHAMRGVRVERGHASCRACRCSARCSARAARAGRRRRRSAAKPRPTTSSKRPSRPARATMP